METKKTPVGLEIFKWKIFLYFKHDFALLLLKLLYQLLLLLLLLL